MVSNKDTFYIKVVALIENNINFLMRQTILRDYYATEILYYFFEHRNILK